MFDFIKEMADPQLSPPKVDIDLIRRTLELQTSRRKAAITPLPRLSTPKPEALPSRESALAARMLSGEQANELNTEDAFGGLLNLATTIQMAEGLGVPADTARLAGIRAGGEQAAGIAGVLTGTPKSEVATVTPTPITNLNKETPPVPTAEVGGQVTPKQAGVYDIGAMLANPETQYKLALFGAALGASPEVSQMIIDKASGEMYQQNVSDALAGRPMTYNMPGTMLDKAVQNVQAQQAPKPVSEAEKHKMVLEQIGAEYGYKAAIEQIRSSGASTEDKLKQLEAEVSKRTGLMFTTEIGSKEWLQQLSAGGRMATASDADMVVDALNAIEDIKGGLTPEQERIRERYSKEFKIPLKSAPKPAPKPGKIESPHKENF